MFQSQSQYCPICGLCILTDINTHLDECLTTQMLTSEEVEGGGEGGGGGEEEYVDDESSDQLGQIDNGPRLFIGNVKCPYETCPQSSPQQQQQQSPSRSRSTINVADFPSHVVLYHSSDSNQKFACPFCALFYCDDHYQVSVKTNLLQHVQNSHSDLLGERFPTQQSGTNQRQPPAQQSGTNQRQPISPMKPSLVVAFRYRNEKLTSSCPGECSICLEDFQKEQWLTRCDCFCCFHKECMEQWLKKNYSCPNHPRF